MMCDTLELQVHNYSVYRFLLKFCFTSFLNSNLIQLSILFYRFSLEHQKCLLSANKLIAGIYLFSFFSLQSKLLCIFKFVIELIQNILYQFLCSSHILCISLNRNFFFNNIQIFEFVKCILICFA